MFRIIRLIVICLGIYSLGFISGMKYHGSEDKAAALQDDLTGKINYARQKGREVIDKVNP